MEILHGRFSVDGSREFVDALNLAGEFYIGIRIEGDGNFLIGLQLAGILFKHEAFDFHFIGVDQVEKRHPAVHHPARHQRVPAEEVPGVVVDHDAGCGRDQLKRSQRLLVSVYVGVDPPAFEHENCLVQRIDFPFEPESRIRKHDLLLSVVLVQLTLDDFAPLVDLLVLRKELDGDPLVFDDVGFFACIGQAAPRYLFERHLQVGAMSHHFEAQLVRIEFNQHVTLLHVGAVRYRPRDPQTLHRHGRNRNRNRLGGLQFPVG